MRSKGMNDLKVKRLIDKIYLFEVKQAIKNYNPYEKYTFNQKE